MEYRNYTDSELITLLREGKPSDNDAFNIIYLKYSSSLYGFCLYTTGSKEETEGMSQYTWRRLCNSVEGYINNYLYFLINIKFIQPLVEKHSKKPVILNND